MSYQPKVYRDNGGDRLVVASGGTLQVNSGGIVTGGGVGTAYYVDGTSGLDANAGTSWGTALLTIAHAVTHAVAGDTIYIKGSFNEAVTCSVAGVKFIGIGTEPSEATWTAPTVAGSFCLKLAAASCLVQNIKFRPVVYTTSGIPSAIRLTAGADYTRIIGCRFQGRAGSYDAIYGDTPVGNVVIDGNEFIYMNTLTYGAAIDVPASTGLACSAWRITNNVFDSCVTAINIDGRTCLIKDNVIKVTGLTAAGVCGSAVCTMGIDLSGADTGGNTVCGNHLGGAYSNSLYLKGTTGDEWAGNWTLSVTATITNAAGMTLTATA